MRNLKNTRILSANPKSSNQHIKVSQETFYFLYNYNRNMEEKITLSPYTPEWEDAIDMQFMQSVIEEVTQSCLLPNPIPLARIPRIIEQVAKWFWQNDDQAVEQRFYLIKNAEFCKGNIMNKIVQLPPQIMAVQGCYKTNNPTNPTVPKFIPHS